jgi:hypothetical protein
MKKKEKGFEGFGMFAEDFHHYSNVIYDRWDEGLKPKKKDMDGLIKTCKEFIASWDMAMDVDRYIYDQNKKLKGE